MFPGVVDYDPTNVLGQVSFALSGNHSAPRENVQALIKPSDRANSTAYRRGDVVNHIVSGYSLMCAIAGTSHSSAPTVSSVDPRTPIAEGSGNVRWLNLGLTYPTATSAEAPTVTVGAASLTKTWDKTMNAWRWLGASFILNDTFGLPRPYCVTKTTGGNLNGSTLEATGIGISFMTDAPIVEIGVAYSYDAKIFIDGIPLHVGTLYAGATSGVQYIKLDFSAKGNRRPRRIDVFTELAGCISAVVTDDNSTIWPTETSGRIFWLADSWQNNVSERPLFPGNYPCYMASRMLGFDDTVASGSGGTGWIATASGTQPNFATRLAVDLMRTGLTPPAPYTTQYTFGNPHVVVVPMSTNDDISTPSARTALAAAGVAIHRAIRLGLPNCIIVFVGLPSTTSTLTNRALAETEALAAITAIGDTRTMTIQVCTATEGAWFTGDGTSAWPSGAGSLVTGNNAFNLRTDGHPTGWTGDRHYAAHFAKEFRRLFPTLR